MPISKTEAKKVAVTTIHIGVKLLLMLDSITGEDWSRQSTFRVELDCVAQRLGFEDAIAVWESIESERQDDSEMWRGVLDGLEW